MSTVYQMSLNFEIAFNVRVGMHDLKSECRLLLDHNKFCIPPLKPIINNRAWRYKFMYWFINLTCSNNRQFAYANPVFTIDM